MGAGDADDSYHVPVLGEAVLAALAPAPDERVVDMTLGGGGHASMLLNATAPGGRLLGLDRDPAALAAAKKRLTPFGDRVTAVHAPFDRVGDVIRETGFGAPAIMLMDLGVSSRQLDDPARGFSFRHDGPLDMRMDTEADIPTAADLVNGLPAGELARIFKVYGEERHARRIATAIADARKTAPVTTTGALARLVEAAVPKTRGPRRIHPATRAFQALRIYVNDELGMLDRTLDTAFAVLAPRGRLGVISFHSLEDRMVKQRFADWCTGCICPREFPECRCGRTPRADRVTRKAVTATPGEIDANPRARSARLRAVRKRPLRENGEVTP